MKFAILSSAVLAASATNDGMAGDCAVVGVRTDTIDDKTHFSIVTMRDYDEGDILYATDAGVGKDRWWSYVATDLAATPSYMHYYEQNGERYECKEFEYWNLHCFVRENNNADKHKIITQNWWGNWFVGWAWGELRQRKYGDVFDNTKVKEAQLFTSTTEEFYGNKGGKRVITEQEFTSFEGFGRYEFTRPTLKGAIITSEDFAESMLAHDPPIDSWNHPDQEKDTWVANLELSNKGDNLFIFTADDDKMPVVTKTRQQFGQHEDCGMQNYCVQQGWWGGCKEWRQQLRQCNHDVSYTVVHPTNKESFEDYNFICGATTSQHGFDDTRWVTAKDMQDVHTHDQWTGGWWGKWQAKYTTLTGHKVDPGNVDALTSTFNEENVNGLDWTTEELEEIIEYFHTRQTEDLHLHSTSLPVPLIKGETAVDLRKPQTGDDNGHRDNWKYVGTALDGTRDEILKKLNKSPYDGGLWEYTNKKRVAASYTQDIKNLFDRDAGHFYIRNPINCMESETEYTQCVSNTGEQCGSGFKTKVIVQDAAGGGLGCPQTSYPCSLGPCETPEPTNSPTDSPTDAPTQFCDPSNCLNWECEDWCKCYNEDLVDEYEVNNCHDDNDANSCICFEGEDVSDNQHRLKKMKKA